MTVMWKMGIHTEKPNRMWLSFPYDQNVIDALKNNVSGCRWDGTGKVWHFPLDLRVARDIRRVAQSFNAGLDIHAELATWARNEKAREASIVAPDDTSDVSKLLPRTRMLYPDIISAMEKKPWQLPGANFIAAQRNVLVADQPGLGKTLQVIVSLIENDVRGPILVVAPRSAVSVTWPEEIERWLGSSEDVTIINSELRPNERSDAINRVKTLWDARHSRSEYDRRYWILCGPNYLRIRADVDQYGNFTRDANGKKILMAVNETVPELFTLKWSSVIVDESHQVLAGGSPGVGKRKWSAQRLGIDTLEIIPNGMRIPVSGTPFRGKTEYLFGTLQWLDPPKYPSYWNFIKRHWGVIRDDNSAWGSGIKRGEKILDERRFFSELKPYMVRRTKGEVEKDLPPKTYGGVPLDRNDPKSPVAVWLPMSAKQQKQYNEIVNHAIITIDAMGDTINVNGVLAEMIRMKQVANACLAGGIVSGVSPTTPSNKIDWLIDFLNERIGAGTKVIVASQFTGFIELLSNELDSKKIGHYVFTGKTNDRDRKQIRESFQHEDGEMVILLNTKSGGVSLTLSQADDVVVCDQTWIPDDQEQVEDRAHRIDRVHNVTIWNLASLGTIDEDVAIVNAERGGAISSILDGQRGVTYVKQLISITKKRIDATRQQAVS